MSVKNKAIKKEKKQSGFFGILFLGLIAAIVSFVVLLNIEKNTLMNYEKVTVVMVKKGDILDITKTDTTVPEGLLLTEDNIPTYFTLTEIEKTKVPTNAITSLKTLENKVVTNILDPGVIITTSFFEDFDEKIQHIAEPVKVSFQADKASQIVAGTIRSGDIIDIYSEGIDEEKKEYGYITKDVWRNVYVYEVRDSSGNLINNSDSKTATIMITVLIGREDVAEFYNGISANMIRVSKISE